MTLIYYILLILRTIFIGRFRKLFKPHNNIIIIILYVHVTLMTSINVIICNDKIVVPFLSHLVCLELIVEIIKTQLILFIYLLGISEFPEMVMFVLNFFSNTRQFHIVSHTLTEKNKQFMEFIKTQ